MEVRKEEEWFASLEFHTKICKHVDTTNLFVPKGTGVVVEKVNVK